MNLAPKGTSIDLEVSPRVRGLEGRRSFPRPREAGLGFPQRTSGIAGGEGCPGRTGPPLMAEAWHVLPSLSSLSHCSGYTEKDFDSSCRTCEGNVAALETRGGRRAGGGCRVKPIPSHFLQGGGAKPLLISPPSAPLKPLFRADLHSRGAKGHRHLHSRHVAPKMLNPKAA